MRCLAVQREVLAQGLVRPGQCCGWGAPTLAERVSDATLCVEAIESVVSAVECGAVSVMPLAEA